MNEFFNLPIKIAVSSCLAGEPVRYDASDKNNSLIVNQYSKYFSLHKICPEVAIGLGVPRNAINLIQDRVDYKKFNLLEVDNANCNYTDRMLSYAKQQSDALKNISGYIVKERSPSCGLRDTPHYSYDGASVTHGAGLFTETLMLNLPWLPVISEEGLDDIAQCDNFLERVFILYLWHTVFKPNNNSDDFMTRIADQIQLRGTNLIALEKLQVSTNTSVSDELIIIILTLLQKPITKAMQLHFIATKLRDYKINAVLINELILNYENNKISLWGVIKQCQELFKANNITCNSNYFYPDEREVKTRACYFGT